MKNLFTFNFNTIIFGFILIVFGLSSCQSIEMRGQFVSDQEIAKIQSSNMSQEEVVATIGSPTYIPEYTPNTWYYIQRAMSKRAWLAPKPTEQRVVRLLFDAQGRVQLVELMDNKFNNSIAMEKAYTKSGGSEQNGVQKFVKHMGRFKSKQKKHPRFKKQ